MCSIGQTSAPSIYSLTVEATLTKPGGGFGADKNRYFGMFKLFLKLLQ